MALLIFCLRGPLVSRNKSSDGDPHEAASEPVQDSSSSSPRRIVRSSKLSPPASAASDPLTPKKISKNTSKPSSPRQKSNGSKLTLKPKVEETSSSLEMEPASTRESEPPPSSHGEEEEQEQSDEEFDAEDSSMEMMDSTEGEGLDEGESEGAISLKAPRGRAAKVKEDKLALNHNDPLQAYLREVQRHPLLTPEEEQSLAQRYAATQDVVAAARLVTANLRLVVKIAYEYRRAYKNIMDLIQEGNIGLMQAVKKFDPNRGVKLSSYSAWWIRAYILRYIINNWRLVKLGTTQAQRKLFFNLNKEKARLAAMGVDPTPEKIAKNLGVEEQEAAEMDRRLSSGEMSLDAPIGDNEGRPVSRIELMASGLTGPDSAVATEELNDIVRGKLREFRKGLKGKEFDIFDKRLVADEPLTLQELGDQFGISRERVRQIEARLMMNLRQYLVQALGDAVEQG